MFSLSNLNKLIKSSIDRSSKAINAGIMFILMIREFFIYSYSRSTKLSSGDLLYEQIPVKRLEEPNTVSKSSNTSVRFEHPLNKIPVLVLQVQSC